MSNLHKHKYILNYKKFTNIVISTVEYFFLLINFKGKKLGHRFLQMSISDKTVIILLIIVELFLVTLVTHWLISCFSDY
jgi:uncharacterized membrane protein